MKKKGTDRTRPVRTFFFHGHPFRRYCLEASISNHHHCFYYSVSKTSNIFLHFLWLIPIFHFDLCAYQFENQTGSTAMIIAVMEGISLHPTLRISEGFLVRSQMVKWCLIHLG